MSTTKLNTGDILRSDQNIIISLDNISRANGCDEYGCLPGTQTRIIQALDGSSKAVRSEYNQFQAFNAFNNPSSVRVSSQYHTNNTATIMNAAQSQERSRKVEQEIRRLINSGSI